MAISATGTYASKNVGTANTITASLSAANFVPGSGVLLSNYALPTTASGRYPGECAEHGQDKLQGEGAHSVSFGYGQRHSLYGRHRAGRPRQRLFRRCLRR